MKLLKVGGTMVCLALLSQPLGGCVAAAAYGVYKWSQADQHSEDQKTARTCLETGQADTPFCQKVLREMVKE